MKLLLQTLQSAILILCAVFLDNHQRGYYNYHIFYLERRVKKGENYAFAEFFVDHIRDTANEHQINLTNRE